jgi:RNA polymerase sigma-70 factor (ECF subfamily)
MDSNAELFLCHVRPHWRRLHVVARQYCHEEQTAADLVQEALLRAWRNFSPTEASAYHRSWLFVILRNVAWERTRNEQRRPRVTSLCDAELTELAAPDPADPFCPLPNLSEAAFREFLDDRIVAALDALEPSFREVLVLSVAGDLSYREIAEVLDCPLGTVMSRMGRARRVLRERLAEFAAVRRPAREARP